MIGGWTDASASVQPVLLRGVNGPCIASGPYSCQRTDARRMFRWLISGSSGAPVAHAFKFIKIWSILHRWIHRCLFYRTIGPSGALGLAGPHVLFLLTVPRAPRVSLTLTSLLPREPPPVPSLRRHAPTRRRCSTRSAPAPPHAHSSSSPAPRPRLARSAPTPPASRPRRACAPALRLFLAAPPLITVANGLLYARSPSCSTPLEFPPRFEPWFEFLAPLVQARSRCSSFCSKGVFFDLCRVLFSDPPGYDLHTSLACVMFPFSYLSHMTTYDLCLSPTHIGS